ncbi:MAG: hypothetical protein MMC23_009390 [Stictis urceolatum]|nr:hypothetical protein [Stictis urceolata]
MSFPNRAPHQSPPDAPPAFLEANTPSFPVPPPSTPPLGRADDPQFDIFSWQPKYASCQRYFLDHAQHSGPVQAVAAFLNIHLPFQRDPPTVNSAPTRASPLLPHPSSSSSSSGGGPSPANIPFQPAPAVSLTPYLRRLVVTGLDFPGVLHGFFGDDWAAGIGPLHEQERRNYLFAAKSGGWAGVKRDYDMPPYETVPFLRPLQGVVEAELQAAERSWSEWLALEDWMVGPRAPGDGYHGRG